MQNTIKIMTAGGFHLSLAGTWRVIHLTPHTLGARQPCAICWWKRPRFAAYGSIRWAVTVPQTHWLTSLLPPSFPLFWFFVLAPTHRAAGIAVLKMQRLMVLKTSSSLCPLRLQEMASITSLCLSELITDPGKNSTLLCCCWITCEFTFFLLYFKCMMLGNIVCAKST